MAARDANRVRRAAVTNNVHAAPTDEPTTLLDSLGDLATQTGLGDEYNAVSDAMSGAPAETLRAILPMSRLADVDYSPSALGAGFLDSLTLGHAGELGGLIRHVARGEDYDQAAATQEARIAQMYQDAPGSALVGTLGGMIPLGAVGGGLGAPGTGSRAMQAFRMARPAAAVGAGVGAIGGGLAADEGEGLEGAGMGALEGMATTVPAALMGVAGHGVRESARGAGLASRLMAPPVAGALTGAGYGWAGAHGADPDAGLEDYATHAGYGAAIGAPLESAGAVVGAGLRMASRGQPRMPPSSEAGIVADVDEASLLWGDGSPTGLVEPEAVASFRTPQQLAEQARAADSRGAVGEAVSSLIESPPEYDRLFSVSATGPGTARQLRAGSNAFGGPANWVRALQDLGLAREGSIYSRPMEREAIIRTRDALGNQARGYHSAVEATGITTEGAAIADALEADAAQLRTRSTAPEVQAAADALEARAQRIRFAESGVELEGEQVMQPRELSYRDVLNELSEQGRLNTEAYSSPLVSSSLTPSQRSGINVYRALADSRNRMAETALGPEQYANMRNTMRGFQATNGIAPVNLRLDINSMHQPANLRGAMGGMASQLGSAIEGGGALDQGISRIAGQAKENLIANYIHSVRATANERWVPGAMERLNSFGIDPATAARMGESLRGQVPGLAALAALRSGAVTDASLGAADTDATSQAEHDRTTGRYDDLAADALDEMTGISTRPDAGVEPAMDQQSTEDARRAADILDEMTGVSTAEEDEEERPRQ
jgi:hypothetical protein